jgi:hypothetical protein
MEVVFRSHGCALTQPDIQIIREVIAANPGLSRRQLSILVCEALNWHQKNGALRDQFCRTVLVELHRAGLIELPLPQYCRNIQPVRRTPHPVEVDRTPICTNLRGLGPLELFQVRHTAQEKLFNYLLESEHYLRYTHGVGERLKVMVFAGLRPVALFLWSSAPRHLGPRDRYIGWSPEQRRRQIGGIAYNSRYLIPSWIQVPHLASHLLARMTRILPQEWQKVYGHPVYFAETFVDRTRHRGTCYRAANWVFMGKTTGRGKDDQTGKPNRSLKDVLGLPLTPDFRERLLSS